MTPHVLPQPRMVQQKVFQSTSRRNGIEGLRAHAGVRVIRLDDGVLQLLGQVR